jgi:hypothetical protein
MGQESTKHIAASEIAFLREAEELARELDELRENVRRDLEDWREVEHLVRRIEAVNNSDHAQILAAVKNGTLSPDWAQRLLRTAPVELPSKTKDGSQARRARTILKKLFPPEGIPPADLMTLQAIGLRVRKTQKRGERPISNDTVARVTGRR